MTTNPDCSQHTRLGDSQYLLIGVSRCHMPHEYHLHVQEGEVEAEQQETHASHHPTISIANSSSRAQAKSAHWTRALQSFSSWTNFVSAYGYHLLVLHRDPDSSLPPELALPLAPTAQDFYQSQSLVMSRYLYHEALMDELLGRLDWPSRWSGRSVNTLTWQKTLVEPPLLPLGKEASQRSS